MEFAWKLKNRFLSTSAKSWNARGRPKRIDEKNSVKYSKNNNSSCISQKKEFEGYKNISKNLNILYSRKYISDTQLEAGCMFNIIAHAANSSILPSGGCSLGKVFSYSKSNGYFISPRNEKNFKKYMRIRKLLIKENVEIDKIIDKIAVKDIEIKSDAKQDATRKELTLLKKGLDIIHEYLKKNCEKFL